MNRTGKRPYSYGTPADSRKCPYCRVILACGAGRFSHIKMCRERNRPAAGSDALHKTT